MGTTLIDNFDYRGKRFLDSRQSVATLAALKAVPGTDIPDGFRAYCAEDKQWYEFNSANEVDATTGKWRPAGACLQESGNSEYQPMSQKAVTDIFTGMRNTFSEIAKKTNGLITDDDSDDKLFITDVEGNVIAEINDKGIKTTNVFVPMDDSFVGIVEKLKEGMVISEDNAEKLTAMLESVLPSDDSFNICDGEGNVAFSIDNTGNVKYNEVKSWMHGKVMMSLCDSLGTSGVWQEKIAELTGMKFDKALNYDGNPDTAFSVGGSQTPSHPNGGFDRARRLVEFVKAGGKVDVVFLENINDSTWVNINSTRADIDEEILTLPPHCETDYMYVNTGKTTSADALKEFKNNLSTYLGSTAPTPGMAVYVGSTAAGKLLTVTHAPTADGTVMLNVGGKTYGISVNATDTMADVVTKIVEIDFADPAYADNKKSDTSVEFMPASGAPSVEFLANGTGVTVTITDTTSKSYYGMTYASYSKEQADWLNPDNWVDKWTIRLTQHMKGLLEYLCTNLPAVQFYWFIPTRFAGMIPAAKKADGSIDFDAYKRENARYELCAYTQKKVCEYYSIPVIDLHNEGGVNIFNQLAYYQLNGGVHPPYATYEYWGEKAISKLI